MLRHHSHTCTKCLVPGSLLLLVPTVCHLVTLISIAREAALPPFTEERRHNASHPRATGTGLSLNTQAFTFSLSHTIKTTAAKKHSWKPSFNVPCLSMTAQERQTPPKHSASKYSGSRKHQAWTGPRKSISSLICWGTADSKTVLKELLAGRVHDQVSLPSHGKASSSMLVKQTNKRKRGFISLSNSSLLMLKWGESSVVLLCFHCDCLLPLSS